jgi:hypothetical protein
MVGQEGVEEPQVAQQLAEYRLRALKCEMSPDDTPLPKPPHRCPRKVRKGQR